MQDLINYSLFTKDGRKMGNAIVVSQDDEHYKIKTDYGNSAMVTEIEIHKYFYIGTEQNDSHKHFKQQ